jgi:hypothetical protein
VRRRRAALRLLATLALAVPLGAGTARGQADRAGQAVEPPVVVDSDGQVLGPVEGALPGADVTVAVRAGGRIIPLVVLPDRLFAFGVVAFESETCGGPALLMPFRAPGVPSFHGEAGIGPGHSLLGAAGPPEVRVIAAMYFPVDTPPCQPVTAIGRIVYPTVELLDLGRFTRPFRVR